MTTETKKYSVSFASRARSKRTFFALAKKNIVKGKRGGARNLSTRIDEIAYGV